MCQNRSCFVAILLLILAANISQAQLCQNPLDTIYGLNSITGSGSGQISGINVNAATTSVIGSPASTSANANGIGYSKATNKFYFFNQTAAGTTEFVSYDPLTGVKTSLAIPSSPAIPTVAAGKLRSGTVNEAGDAYYTIFPGATTAMGYPLTAPAFYYYNIPGNNWVRITQSFRDISNNTVNEIRTLNSGDMAFDGFGRLWIVCSSNTNYAMYRINGPLPTASVANITVDTIIPSRPTPAGVSITGVAFNSSGNLYLSSGSGVGVGNNQLYRMTMAASPLTNIGTLPNGVGDDLASCINPFVVLPSYNFQFNAAPIKNAIQLVWKTAESTEVLGYEVEYSTDGRKWEKIAFTARDLTQQSNPYVYNDYKYKQKDNYYRIVQISLTGQIKYSAIQRVAGGVIMEGKISITSVNNDLVIFGKDLPAKYTAQIYDNTGRMVFSGTVNQVIKTIDISNLTKGLYFLKLFHSELKQQLGMQKFIKY